MPCLTDVARIFNDRDVIAKSAIIKELEDLVVDRDNILCDVLSNHFLLGVLHIAALEATDPIAAWDCVDVEKSRLEPLLYMEDDVNKAIATLPKLGFALLLFNDDSDCPFNVSWCSRRPSSAILASYRDMGWDWIAPNENATSCFIDTLIL